MKAIANCGKTELFAWKNNEKEDKMLWFTERKTNAKLLLFAE